MANAFHIGQVVWVLPSPSDAAPNRRIVPLLIVEEVSRKTVKGEKTTFLAVSPTRSKPFDIEKVDGETFVDIEHLRVTLIDRASEQISLLIKNANDIAIKAYNIDMRATNNDEMINIVDERANQCELEDANEIVIDLGDGKIAHVGKIAVGDTKHDLK